jgi:hypothetical protein
MNSLMTDSTERLPALAERGLPLAPFGPAPLIEGENAAAYDEFLIRISSAVRPADIFEEIWVRDIVDLVWEALRLQAGLFTAGARKALVHALAPVLGWAQPSGHSPAASPRAPATKSLCRASAPWAGGRERCFGSAGGGGGLR